MDITYIKDDNFNQTYLKLNLHNEKLADVRFEECVFDKCTFHEIYFKSCKFLNCVFKVCDINMMKVTDCSFTNIRFEDSKIIAVDWTEANWSKHVILNALNFENCIMNHSTFIGLNLTNINMINCIAKDVDFTDANLTQANCTHTDFSNSRFINTNLTKADFRNALNYAINVNQNLLKKTRFSLPEAMSLLYGLDIILSDG